MFFRRQPQPKKILKPSTVNRLMLTFLDKYYEVDLRVDEHYNKFFVFDDNVFEVDNGKLVPSSKSKEQVEKFPLMYIGIVEQYNVAFAAIKYTKSYPEIEFVEAVEPYLKYLNPNSKWHILPFNFVHLAHDYSYLLAHQTLRICVKPGKRKKYFISVKDKLLEIKRNSVAERKWSTDLMCLPMGEHTYQLNELVYFGVYQYTLLLHACQALTKNEFSIFRNLVRVDLESYE